jgi:hypothetical protein
LNYICSSWSRGKFKYQRLTQKKNSEIVACMGHPKTERKAINWLFENIANREIKLDMNGSDHEISFFFGIQNN